jgi:integrase
MAGKRKSPKLRRKGNCYIANIYKPDGSRTTISFGRDDERTEGQIYEAFGQWLDLYKEHPHKTLSYGSPYEAITEMTNPTTVRTVGEAYDAYERWAGQSMLPLRDGRSSPELLQIGRCKKFLEPYREWTTSDFGPDELRAIQEEMVAYRYIRTQQAKSKEPPEQIAYTRTSINRLVNQIRKMWQWAMAREIVSASSVQLLKEVKSLRIGRTTARDNLKRAAVTEEELDKVIEHISRVVGDMLRLIWITAMRSSEVCRMRPFDILRDDESCWLYIPGRDVSPIGDHKTAHHQRIRAVPLPRSAQAVLQSRVSDFESLEYIFTPAEAVQELLDRRADERRTPLKYGNRPGTNRTEHPMITPGKTYALSAFSLAVKRACQRAGVTRFTPRDLRRTAATRIRSQLTKEAAKLLLGHVSTDTTDIYLLDEVKESMKVAKQLDGSHD